MTIETRPFARILLLKRHRRPSEEVLAGAAELARRCGSRLTFAQALEGGDRIDELSRTELLNELRTALAPHLGELEADYRLLDGDMAQAASLAYSDHDLIVPAAGGPGSEAARIELDKLLRRSPLPVWLQGGDSSLPQGILAAVDLQTRNPAKLELNLPIIRHAAALASRLGARLDLLTVRRPRTTSRRLLGRLADGEAPLALSRRETRNRLQSLLGQALSGLEPLAIEPRLLVSQGDHDTLIAQAAGTDGVDLLVAGSLGRGGLAGWIFGDTAARLSQRLDCSILAVKQPRAANGARRPKNRSRAA